MPLKPAFTTEDEAIAALAIVADRDPGSIYFRRGEDGQERDEEDAHKDADSILVAALRHLGWGKLADEFEKRQDDFWYS